MPIVQKMIILIGLIFLGITFIVHFESKKLESWQTTQGILTESISYQGSSSKQAFKVSDFSNIKYSYVVNNINYSGYRLSPLEYIYFNKANLLNLPKPNNSIKVFYNPKSPKDSLLFVEYPLTQVIMFLFSSVILLLVGSFYKKIKKYLLNLIHPSSDIASGGNF